MQFAPSNEARDRLLNTAEQLIYAGGIHATGMDRIVRESGVSRKSVYRYFASKEELVAEALRRRDERWMTWFATEVNNAATPRDSLLALFAVLRSWFASDGFHGCAFINAAGETADASAPIRKVAKQHKERLQAFVQALCVAAGEDDPEAAARQFLILIDGAIAVALVTGNPAAADDACALAKALLRRPER